MNLVERAQKILLQPQQEWYVIQQEPTQPAELYTGYIIPLAAIGPVASLIGHTIFGYGLYAPPIFVVIIGSIILYVLSLGGIYVSALIVDALAPTFASQKSINQALKLVAYASTPGWIAGILNLVPVLGILAIIAAFYGIYLFYLGVPVMMRTPQDKAVPYIVTTAVVCFVIYFIIFAIAGAITASMIWNYRGL
ncbi:MAG: Yip1 family protein [Blastocatellia bacterium]